MNYTLIAEYSQIASAVLFVLALAWIWVKFLQPAVVAAEQKTNDSIAAAERHREEVKARFESVQGEIAAAHEDAERILTRAKTQAQSEHEQIVREAREAGERSLRSARGELERARAAAREQLREEIVVAALDLARADAARRVDARVDAHLVSAFLSRVEREGAK